MEEFLSRSFCAVSSAILNLIVLFQRRMCLLFSLRFYISFHLLFRAILSHALNCIECSRTVLFVWPFCNWFRWTTTKKWTFGVSQLVLILPVWKCLFLMQSLDFCFSVCVLIVWWKLRSDVFGFLKCALQVSVCFCGICF